MRHYVTFEVPELENIIDKISYKLQVIAENAIRSPYEAKLVGTTPEDLIDPQIELINSIIYLLREEFPLTVEFVEDTPNLETVSKERIKEIRDKMEKSLE